MANVLELRTPGLVLSEMETVDSVLKSLVADVVAADLRSEQGIAYRRALTQFAQEWVGFYDSHSKGFSSWWARGTSPVYDKTKNYRLRLSEYQLAFQKLGGSISQPGNIGEPKRALPTWAVLGAIGGVVFGGAYLLKQRADSLARKALPPWQR